MSYTLDTFIKSYIEKRNLRQLSKLDNILALEIEGYRRFPSIVDYLKKLRVFLYLKEVKVVDPKKYSNYKSK